MGLKWFITGGCGFIGTNLIRYLVKDVGNQIRVIDNFSVGTPGDLGEVCQFKMLRPNELNENSQRWDHHNCQLIEGDISDDKIASLATNSADVIVHLAANTGVAPSVQNPRQDCIVNVIGTLNYLESARKNSVKKFIFASSGAPVGEVKPPIHEDLPLCPVSPYGASKMAGEGYCSAYFHSYGISTVILRFSNVYGPGSLRKNSVVAKFVKGALDGDTLQIYGDGNQTRDFIYISDLINAINLAVEQDNVGGQKYQIATGVGTTIIQLMDILTECLKAHGITGINKENLGSRTGDVKQNYSDISKAFKILGWQSSVSLELGLRMTIEDFIRERDASKLSKNEKNY